MNRFSLATLVLLFVACDSATELKTQSQPMIQAVADDEFLVRQSPADGISRAACDFLWDQQRPDGSWGSNTYGILSSGQAFTPFVLYSLLQFDEQPSATAIDNALAFMRSKIRGGAIGLADPDVMEYPVYSTAYALMCFKMAGSLDDAKLIAEMQRYLISEQFTEQRGFDRDHCAYGGWGFGGIQPDGQTGHMDLAHTRRVLDALSLQPADRKKLADVQHKAEVFLKMVQKHPSDGRPQPLPDSAVDRGSLFNSGFDGGFYFSPVVLAANKGRLSRTDPPHWRSYATTTCDGLLALLSAGVPREDERVTSAIKWLKTHAELDYCQGIPEIHQGSNWRDAVKFYHLSVRGEVARLLGNSRQSRHQMAAGLARHQNSDGSFVNRNSLMKEDDPILATTLAVIALGRKPVRVE